MGTRKCLAKMLPLLLRPKRSPATQIQIIPKLQKAMPGTVYKQTGKLLGDYFLKLHQR
jgi:hypothetical protein